MMYSNEQGATEEQSNYGSQMIDFRWESTQRCRGIFFLSYSLIFSGFIIFSLYLNFLILEKLVWSLAFLVDIIFLGYRLKFSVQKEVDFNFILLLGVC